MKVSEYEFNCVCVRVYCVEYCPGTLSKLLLLSSDGVFPPIFLINLSSAFQWGGNSSPSYRRPPAPLPAPGTGEPPGVPPSARGGPPQSPAALRPGGGPAAASVSTAIHRGVLTPHGLPGSLPALHVGPSSAVLATYVI